jgi:hypothetical protein
MCIVRTASWLALAILLACPVVCLNHLDDHGAEGHDSPSPNCIGHHCLCSGATVPSTHHNDAVTPDLAAMVDPSSAAEINGALTLGLVYSVVPAASPPVRTVPLPLLI